MNINFSTLDKSDFKCLKTPDGAIYYGQCVQILPPDVDTDKLSGFRDRDEAKKPQPVITTQPNTGSSSALEHQQQQMAATISSTRSIKPFDVHQNSASMHPLAILYKEGVEPLVVEDISQIDEELLPKLVTVRHGHGIQIQADKISKYAGEWHYGSRHGDGHLVAPDGSEYRGNLQFGQFNGIGQFNWPTQKSETCQSDKMLGHSYMGSWKMGMMHGEGQFNHAEGQVLKSLFCNNLFRLQDGLFVNPFDTRAEMRAHIERISSKKEREAVEERKRNERVTIHRVNDIQCYGKTLLKVRDAGRTPLVVSTLQNPIDTQDCVISMGWDMSEMNNTWLRTVAKFNTHALGWLSEARNSYRQTYERALAERQPWVMNLMLDEDEDSSDPWPHHYDPEYDFLFGAVGPGLPLTVWEGHKVLKDLNLIPEQIKEVLEKHYSEECERVAAEQAAAAENDSQHKGKNNLSPRAANQSNGQNQQQFYLNNPSSMGADAKNGSSSQLDPRIVMQKRLDELAPELARNMNFTVFSKTKFDENMDEAQLLEAAKKRYEKSLPLQYIDIVLVQSLDEAPVVEDNPDAATGGDGDTNQIDAGSIGQKTNQ